MNFNPSAIDARIENAKRAAMNVAQVFIEIWKGLVRDDPVLFRLCLLGSALGLVVITGVDFWLLKSVDKLRLYPPDGWIWHAYAAGVTILPMLAFGAGQSAKQRKFARGLKDVFDVVGLRNAIGRYPNFISLEMLSGGTQRLRLTSGGFSLNEWKSKQASLGTNLRVFIDEIRDHTDRGIVELTFSFDPMPDRVSVENIKSYREYSFMIGRDRTRSYIGSFAESPHLLVAGESGGGKSSFLRQMIVSLKVNQPEAEFHLVDLKEGIDIAPLSGFLGMHAYQDSKATAKMLIDILTVLQRRLSSLKALRLNDIGQYFATSEYKQKSIEERRRHDLGRRIFVVVDECAELLLFGSGKDGALTREIRSALSRIARLGRAAGVHLVLGTQRPDKSAVDPQVKSNLTTIVCFRLNDIGGSLAVLGTGRANDLPKIKGRAILQQGADEIEIQTPFLDFKSAQDELKSSFGEPADSEKPANISQSESGIVKDDER